MAKSQYLADRLKFQWVQDVEGENLTGNNVFSNPGVLSAHFPFIQLPSLGRSGPGL
jgi:hypothetical protein